MDDMDFPCCKVSSHIHADTSLAHQTEDEAQILCAACHQSITHHRFQILIHGQWIHVFANPHGIVFEIGCFGKATGVSLVSQPSDEFSWFPGYAWRISGCSNCHVHLGWQFSSRDHSFYGLILDKLINI